MKQTWGFRKFQGQIIKGVDIQTRVNAAKL